MSELIEKYKKKTKEGIYAGLHKDVIEHNICVSDDYLKLSTSDQLAVKSVVADTIANHNSYKFIQRIMNSKILLFQDSNDVLGYSELDRKTFKVQLDFLNKVIKTENLKDLYVNVYSAYDPHKNLMMFEKDGNTMFNVYQPPFWKEAHYFDSAPIEPHPLPEIYAEFFNILVQNDEANLKFLLSWMAYSLRGRNKTTLVTLGAQGSGKGVLGIILSLLHGPSNYSYTDGKKITDGFNSFLNNVTMVYFDEIEIKTTDQENSFKMLANDEIMIREMYKDYVRKTNHANIYMSSNNLSSIRVNSEDRRYSILNITNQKLINQPGWEDMDSKITALYKLENIELLARFLWHYEYDVNALLRKFESERSKEIKQASITDWEDYFLNVYCIKRAGETLLMQTVKGELREEMDNSGMNKLTQNSFKNLADKVKSLSPTGDWVFQLVRPVLPDGTQPISIKIQELQFQPKNITKNFQIEE